MEKQNRYATSGCVENQYMPGSDGKVLKNLLGISFRQEIECVETELLFEVTDRLINEVDRKQDITAKNIIQLHQSWLDSVYSWAGTYRQVLISKGNFTFAAPAYLPQLMEEFEKKVLSQYTPCNFSSKKEIVTALAIVHTELLLIHPFREGNGRISRLLAKLMALQAGLPLLDFSILETCGAKRQQEYFAAVRYGLNRNYDPMRKIFTEVISHSI